MCVCVCVCVSVLMSLCGVCVFTVCLCYSRGVVFFSDIALIAQLLTAATDFFLTGQRCFFC